MLRDTTIKSAIKSEIKNTILLGIPLIASQLIYACSGFIGTALVAHLGKNALAASVLVSMIWMSMSVFFFGILNAVSVLVSHQHGAKNDKAISEIMGQAYWLGLVICVVMFAVLACMPLFLRWSAQPPIVRSLATEYMRAMLWTIPGLVSLIIGEQFLAGIGRAKTVLRISMLVVPVEIPIIYALIFGKFGLPTCGVAGIGYGFSITYTITAIGLGCYLLTHQQMKKYHIFASLKVLKFNYFKELIRVGLPMGLMHAIEVSAFAVATFYMARFGTSMLAAHQITLQYLGFAITVVFAMSQAVTVRVGHAVGRQDLASIQYAVYVGMGLSFCCVFLVSLAFYLIPTFFLRLDLDIYAAINQDLIQHASVLLAISGVLLIFDNFRIIGFGALRGLKDTQFPMLASFISFWLIGLTSAFFFGFIMHLEGKGVWYGLTLGIATGAVIVFIRLRYLLRRINLAALI